MNLEVHRWAVLVLLLHCASVVHAQTKDSPAMERLSVGGAVDQPPYAYMNHSGVYTGFSVDIIRAAGEALGIEQVLFYPSELAVNLKALTQGTIDCVNFVPYTPELANDFLYAAVYLESPSVIFVKRDRYDLVDLQDLERKRIAVVNYDPAYPNLRHLRRTVVLAFDRLPDAFAQLVQGQVDAYVGERLTTLHFLQTQKLENDFKIVGKEVARSRFGVLVRKDQDKLADALSHAFRQLDQNGQHDRVFYHWFGEGYQPQPFLSSPVIRWVTIFVGVSLLVAMIVLGWNLLLQRELELKAIAIEKAILDRKIAEEKSRFEAVVQSMTEGLMLVEPTGRIAYVNAPGAQYFGRRIKDLLNQPIRTLYDFLFAQLEEPGNFTQKTEVIESNPTRPATLEYTITTTKRLDIRLKLFPVRDQHGEFAGRGVLIEDVTHEREVDRLKSEFVSIASHELRTPMTSIMGFSEIMLNQNLPPDLMRRYTTQIHSESERLTRILNDMLDISYLESGEGVLDKQDLCMGELVQEVTEKFRAQLGERRQLQMHLDDALPEIKADRDKITQVLWNLLSNADKYSPAEKKILVGVTYRQKPDPDWGINSEDLETLLPAIELRVQDFGQGIPDDQLSMIFIPFYRVEREVHTIRGTGLGLAIVKRIVEGHHGRVWATSRLGQGTIFYVLLPVAMS